MTSSLDTATVTSTLDIDMVNRVRELRVDRGLTQVELASRLRVSRQTVNSIEVGRYVPSLPLALALARFFETSVEAMFDDGSGAAAS